MCIFIKSLLGTIFVMFVASMASLVGATTAAANVDVDRASGFPVLSDAGANAVQVLAEDASNATLRPLGAGAYEGSGFWAIESEDAGEAWLEVPSRYVDSMGFNLEGAAQTEYSRWPGRTDSPFELNDIDSHAGPSPDEYVSVPGVKPQLNANLNLERRTREGWSINGNMVGTLPEPGTLLLMGLGLLGLGLARRRAAKKAL